MATLILGHIERGTVSFGTTDTSQTVTLATTLADTTKTVLFFTANCNSDSPLNYHISGRVLSTTQIIFERAGTPAVAATVYYEVAEFTQGITVQHLTVAMSSTTVDTTINSVDTTKAFCIVTQKYTGSTFGADDIATFDITSSTNLRAIITTSNAANVHAVQVIQIDDASVQKLSGAMGTATTKDVTVTTINSSNTFWVFTLNSATNVVMSELPYLTYIDSTTLRFTRAGTNNFNYVAFVVSLSAGVSVQNIATTIASGSTTVTPEISAINVNSTTLLVNGYSQKHLNSNTGTDNAGYSMITLSGLTSTAFTATRASNPAVSAQGYVQVLSWLLSGGQVLWIQDDD